MVCNLKSVGGRGGGEQYPTKKGYPVQKLIGYLGRCTVNNTRK